MATRKTTQQAAAPEVEGYAQHRAAVEAQRVAAKDDYIAALRAKDAEHLTKVKAQAKAREQAQSDLLDAEDAHGETLDALRVMGNAARTGKVSDKDAAKYSALRAKRDLLAQAVEGLAAKAKAPKTLPPTSLAAAEALADLIREATGDRIPVVAAFKNDEAPSEDGAPIVVVSPKHAGSLNEAGEHVGDGLTVRMWRPALFASLPVEHIAALGQETQRLDLGHGSGGAGVPGFTAGTPRADETVIGDVWTLPETARVSAPLPELGGKVTASDASTALAAVAHRAVSSALPSGHPPVDVLGDVSVSDRTSNGERTIIVKARLGWVDLGDARPDGASRSKPGYMSGQVVSHDGWRPFRPERAGNTAPGIDGPGIVSLSRTIASAADSVAGMATVAGRVKSLTLDNGAYTLVTVAKAA